MSLAGIVGNRELIGSLFAELATRPSHTYLFAGPRGVGKSLVARGVAHSILCERAPGADFCCSVESCPLRAAVRTNRSRATRCDCCDACVQIASGVHPDFNYISRAANRSDVLIEQARSLIDTLGVKPLRGPRRVAIIDDAETLNLPAQNALLKTLEEPPGHTLILLVCANERALLDTVRSRARLIRFRALTAAELTPLLALRLNMSPDQGVAIARLARGSLARALEIAEGEAPPVRELLDALNRADSLDFASIQSLAQQFFGARDQARDSFELLARLLEEILCFKLLSTELPTEGDTAKLMSQLSHRLDASALAVLAERALRAHAAIDGMANSRLQAESWWMGANAVLRGV